MATGRIGSERRDNQRPEAVIFFCASSVHSSAQRAGQRPLWRQDVGCLDAPQQESRTMSTTDPAAELRASRARRSNCRICCRDEAEGCCALSCCPGRGLRLRTCHR